VNLLTRYLEQRAYTQHLGHPAQWLDFTSGYPGASGVDVSERTAVTWTAIASGIRLCAETLASLPVDLSRRRDTRGREPLPDHPVAQLFAFPNPEMSGFEFRELLQTHIDLWGNGYAHIVWNQGGIPIELWPINPDRVTIERDPSDNLVYRVGLPNESFGRAQTSTVLPAEDVLHIRGWSRHGLLGERMVQTFREAIGLGLATELFGALFFGQGANAGGILEHPSNLSLEAQDRLRQQKERQASGLGRAHRLLILEEGMKWHQTTVEPEKAQFLGTRKFQVTEAARMLRVPPHLLYDLERATFTNIEHQGIEFVTYSMLARVQRWEQRAAMQLLGRKDRHRVQIKFNLASLLRGDTTAQTAAFTAGRQGGWFSPNDIREYLDLNPRPGGDVYADQPAGVPAASPAPQPEDDDADN
jgi:HK97 family phage portal protein